MKRVEQPWPSRRHWRHPLRSMLHQRGDLLRLLLSKLRSASVGKPLHKKRKKIPAVAKQHSAGKQRSRRHFRGKATPCWIPSWRP